MAKRVRCMCRHVQQAELKESTAVWFLQMPWVMARRETLQEAFHQGASASSSRASAPLEDSKEIKATTDEASNADYYYGFDKEFNAAWRVPAGSVGNVRKEYSSDLFGADGSKPTDSAMCRWSDGTWSEITELTVEDLATMQRIHGTKRSKGRPGGSLWTGKHVISRIQTSSFRHLFKKVLLQCDFWGRLGANRGSSRAGSSSN